MDNYYSVDELREFGVTKIGKNLKISRKASLYNCSRMEFGDYVRIDDFCVLSGKLVFGNHIHIAPFCLVAGANEGVYFGDFSGLAYRVSIFTRSDDYSGTTLTNPTVPEKYRHATIKASINIGKHAIIGANTVVFPGAHIAEGCSIGAQALVTKPTEAWGVYAGAPAVRRKDRLKDLLNQEKLLLIEEKGL